MIRIQQLKLQPGHTKKDLYERVARTLKTETAKIDTLQIFKQSIDARKKPEIWLSYVVDVTLKGQSEEKCVARCRNKNVSVVFPAEYAFPAPGTKCLKERPVIIGTGPAGLFCGYLLAQHGYRPILLERGQDVDQRKKDVTAFWEGGTLNPESNVSFGEGGAGTFSDGKLNTLIRDKDGKGRRVLQIFVENGAQPEILYEGKPHIGTDVLTQVVKNMRNRIREWGGEVRFSSRVDGLITDNNEVKGVVLANGERILSSHVVLAIGHSARDTFAWLEKAGIQMEAKSFAVGLRVEHPQSLINAAQYGMEEPQNLPPSPYKVTARTKNGRGVYSFCMCPGGYVVNASSEHGCLVVNGMSYSKRDSANANSAIIVSVTPEDYGAQGPLSGVAFQRGLEQRAFWAADGAIPVQRYGDFSGTGKEGKIPDSFMPCIKGRWQFSDVASILPGALYDSFVEGMEQFGRIIPGFDEKNALVSGIESRTSSPVRITRDDAFQSNLRGLYPCGEGAGYAGGITSAAMDGMRIAEAIASGYAPF